MKPIEATKLDAALREIGVDSAALPELAKLEPTKLRRVMKTFSQALGVPCAHCHDPKNFRAPTPNKAIATRMWNDYTRRLTFATGAPAYCDSCHQGHAKFLDRGDHVALSEWMTENFTHTLKPRGDSTTDHDSNVEHGCRTCHGEPFNAKILEKWAVSR